MLLSVQLFLVNNKPQLWVVTIESDQFFTTIFYIYVCVLTEMETSVIKQAFAFILAVHGRTQLKPVVHHQFLLLEIMFTSMFTFKFLAAGQATAVGSLESGNFVVYGPL